MSFWSRVLALFGIGPAAFHDTTIHGVPNLAIVGPHLWRMGQPTGPEAWAYLTRWVAPEAVSVKLNDHVEGVDVVPTGWTLAEHPMPPFDDKPWTARVEKFVTDLVHGLAQAMVHSTGTGDGSSEISPFFGGGGP